MVNDLLDDEGEGRVVVVEGRAREDRHHLTRPPPIGRPQVMIRLTSAGLDYAAAARTNRSTLSARVCAHPPTTSQHHPTHLPFEGAGLGARGGKARSLECGRLHLTHDAHLVTRLNQAAEVHLSIRGGESVRRSRLGPTQLRGRVGQAGMCVAGGSTADRVYLVVYAYDVGCGVLALTLTVGTEAT